jgi:hypothetical protein
MVSQSENGGVSLEISTLTFRKSVLQRFRPGPRLLQKLPENNELHEVQVLI